MDPKLHRRANGDLRTGSEAEALLLSPNLLSVTGRKANIRKKRKGTFFKYKEDFIDTVLNAFKLEPDLLPRFLLLR